MSSRKVCDICDGEIRGEYKEFRVQVSDQHPNDRPNSWTGEVVFSQTFEVCLSCMPTLPQLKQLLLERSAEPGKLH